MSSVAYSYTRLNVLSVFVPYLHDVLEHESRKSRPTRIHRTPVVVRGVANSQGQQRGTDNHDGVVVDNL